ncbi:MAG: ABC transporter permease subunit [Candidatus Promineifilaceae bacterium]|jgi:multiple sugar transport system permease protein
MSTSDEVTTRIEADPEMQQAVATTEERSTSFFRSRRFRKIAEASLAYLFLLPAFLIVFIFGIYPIAFSIYQSTQRGLNKIVGTYTGMGNYVRAIGDLAYVLGFWMALLLVFMAVRGLWQARTKAVENEDRPWLLAFPAALLAVGFAVFTWTFFTLLPLLLGTGDQIRAALRAGATETSSELFLQFIAEGLKDPQLQRLFWASVLIMIAAFLLTLFVRRKLPENNRINSYYVTLFTSSLLIIGGVALFAWVLHNVVTVYAEAAADAEPPGIWTYVATISAGFVLLALSWVVWRNAGKRESTAALLLQLTAGSLLIIGAYILIVEIPSAAASGDAKWYRGLTNTLYYSLGTLPFQFIFALLLAVFLFQKIRFKTGFRMIFFMPYITPVVGAAAIFRMLFSGQPQSLMNRLIGFFGLGPWRWLNEPIGIFQLIAGDAVNLPTWLAGPSLALVVVMIFGVWTFVGFNTVILLAGLGGIPPDVYEAASIDGANGWQKFRHVTLPLLSSTIYFLFIYALIGTFKAFNHIYVLRNSAQLGSTDTASVVIFDAFQRDSRFGYAAALSVLLLLIVLGLTAVNNRLSQRGVYYG